MKEALVVFYSYSGTTKGVAEMIQQELRCEMFEIKETFQYSHNYSELLKQAKQQIKAGDMIGLKGKMPDIRKYGLIFAGSPNWWNTIAPPLASFLRLAGTKDKIIVPFITHGGGGLGNCVKDMQKLCPDAKVIEGIDANQKSNVLKYLGNIKA